MICLIIQLRAEVEVDAGLEHAEPIGRSEIEVFAEVLVGENLDAVCSPQCHGAGTRMSSLRSSRQLLRLPVACIVMRTRPLGSRMSPRDCVL